MAAIFSLMLVAASVAVTVGIAVLGANLALDDTKRPTLIQPSPISYDQDELPGTTPTPDTSAVAPVVTRQCPLRLTPEAPPFGAVSLWPSEIYSQRDFTLWDRIRVNPRRDWRAFLLDTANQIHAPETAATPWPHHASAP